MKTPRYTDTHRYRRGYRKAVNTDIKATFRRIREEREAAPSIVTPLKRAAK